MKFPELILGNIFVRRNIGKKDDVVDGHAHNFDHATYVVIGSIRVVMEETGQPTKTKTFNAPDMFLVRAGIIHTITFLEDGRFDCIYAHRDYQGRIVEHYTGFEKGYE